MLSSGDVELVDLCKCCDDGNYQIDWTQVIFGHRFCRFCGHHQYIYVGH